jgi:DNA-binding transcriptional MerR regulator
MNNNIKNSFSIKDLENLSGIKAHTIRIWEKRYNLLEPNRSGTNIRNYDILNLQRLLNVAYLNNEGLKISKIADLSSDEINLKVKEIGVGNKSNENAINSFKIAMLNFDQAMFESVYNKLLARLSFRKIFIEVFIDLLEEIGLLWQTNTITPAHEHFISNLIKQKVLTNIELVQNIEKSSEKTFILFLPLNEIHELGLLFIDFELSLKGYDVVYLGQSVPIDNLIDLQKRFSNTEFVSYFTISPTVENTGAYLEEFNAKILEKRNEKLHLLGRNTKSMGQKSERIIVYNNFIEFINTI